ncbi:Lpg1974 family pore-forming outer membrane protein [Calycomorphotria hydatis]|uniref:Uncharacterized protein n=1 Tax=Calycomorphotria hydatis TaxID=2528027 RepID=A0A517T357_9PLAN|nr:Lpg1974 family pore-forming outer membrane protein [Calycomorphotria hydatis]QDT62814.1 hypothetical protein V22_00120 [Calycomorphotria hydatis]
MRHDVRKAIIAAGRGAIQTAAILIVGLTGVTAQAQDYNFPPAPPADVPNYSGELLAGGVWATPLAEPIAVAQNAGISPEAFQHLAQTQAPPQGAVPTPTAEPSAPVKAPTPNSLDDSTITSSGPVFMAPETIVGGPAGAPMMSPGYGGSYGGSVGGAYGGGMGGFGAGTCGPGGCGISGYQMGNPCGGCGMTGSCGCMPESIYHGYGGGDRVGFGLGFDFVFLKPRFGRNDAFFMEDPTAGTGQNYALHHDFKTGWRVWAELVGDDDFGGRVRWFTFDQAAERYEYTANATSTYTVRLNDQFANPTNTGDIFVLPASAGDNIRVSGGLDVDVFDAEMSQRIRMNNWLFNVGGGFRYGKVTQDSNVTLSDAGGVIASSQSNNSFHGIGPVAFAEMRRPIGCSGLSILANVRGSMLYGDHKDSIVNFDSTAVTTTQQYHTNNQDLIPIAEMQLGVEWSVWLSNISVFSIQVAWETQTWFGTGNTRTRDDDLGFDGFTAAMALEW